MAHSIDQLDSEVETLTRSGSFEDATERLTAAWTTYLPEHPAELRERVVALPEEHWCANPALLIALAASHRAAAPANSFAALVYLDAADRAMEDNPSAATLELSVQSSLVRSSALRGLGRVRVAQEHARAATAAAASLHLPARIAMEASAHLELGICLALASDLDSGDRHLREGLAVSDANSPTPIIIEALGWLAVTEWFTHGATHPKVQVERARDAARRAGTPRGIAEVPAELAAALVAIDEGDTASARARLEGIEDMTAGTEYEVFRLQLLAVVHGATAGPLEELEALQGVQLLLHDWQSPSLLHQLHDAERAAALIQLGSMSSARDAIIGLSTQTLMTADVHHAHCAPRLLARLAMHTGDYEQVLQSTATCRTLGDSHAPRSLAYVDALRAAAHDALGDASTAAMTMDRALVLASRTGWRRHFTTLPQERLLSLVDSARTREQPPASLKVLDELRRTSSPDLVEGISPLSTRERLILAHIVAGKSRKEMSVQLRVSPNTIKSQVRSIYRKLGAANRHEAVDRASKYGIRT
jgi:LuxR family maltose regulon positive regulatory protein